MKLLMTLSILAAFPLAAATSKSIHSQPSFVLETKEVWLAVTALGGHMAPVTFFRGSAKPVQPYHISPWQFEKASKMPVPVLVPLRGDFFCMPFGGNSEVVAGEKHPPHGEVAGSKWGNATVQKNGAVTTLSMSLDTTARKGRVTKELSLVEGENVVYSRHIISGFAGNVPLGHHATLSMPEKEGAVRLATSAIQFGMTYPGIFGDPKSREYQSLLPGAKWSDLAKVPVAWKEQPDANLTQLPARFGYADLVQIFNEPAEKSGGPAWTAATFQDEGFLWFSLKDQAVLRSTVFWIENHGRHGHPWNGRNNCLGLEDVTAHFADGLAISTSENVLTKAGMVTAIKLSADQPTSVNYIQGAVKIPGGFENVKTLEFTPGAVTFISTTGKRVTAPVRHEFLKTGKL